MKSKILIFAIAAATIMLCSSYSAESKSPFSKNFFGGELGWNFTNHTGVVHQLKEDMPEIDDTDMFGMNFYFGLNYTVALTRSADWNSQFDIHLNYNGFTASYQKVLSDYEIQQASGESIYEDVTYVTDYDFGYWDLTLLYKQQLANSNFSISGGISAMLNSSASIRQIILVKNDDVAVDPDLNPTLDNEYEVDLVDASSTLFVGQLRASYLFQKKKLFIEPFFSYQLFFNPMIKGTDWKATNFCLGVGIKFEV
jgi:hypothetical protein